MIPSRNSFRALGVIVLALGILVCPALAGTTLSPSFAPGISLVKPNKRVKLAISGMDCKNCESGIKGELDRTPGVVASSVSYERQEAVVDYDPAKITTAGIIAAIKGAGFTAKIKRS